MAGKSPVRLTIVGPCASGKSTLAARLRERGLDVRTPAQEHSEVPSMWLRFTRPDVLVYLDAANHELRRRRPEAYLGDEKLARERRRLAHAREHAHLCVDTTHLTPEEVFDRVWTWLLAHGLVTEESNDERGESPAS